jgi:peptidoglycan/xylan/chitin deacetylase (PgdA/CDA1 family)
MADPATAGMIGSFAVLAILLALLVLMRPSLLVRHLLAPLLPGVIFRADRQRRELALTIDDGPSPGSDGSRHTGSMALLALLRELQVPATLFVISGHLGGLIPPIWRRPAPMAMASATT